MKNGICKVCKNMRVVDSMGYCSHCYPYDKATDWVEEEASRRGCKQSKVRKRYDRRNEEGQAI